MISPMFFLESESGEGAIMKYKSERRGFDHYLAGILIQVQCRLNKVAQKSEKSVNLQVQFHYSLLFFLVEFNFNPNLIQE